MYSFGKVWSKGLMASIDDKILSGYLDAHKNQVSEINKSLMRLKSLGHVMGADLRNNIVTDVHIPNEKYWTDRTAWPYKGVQAIKTIRLDHKITSSFINQDRKQVLRIAESPDHLDHIFTKLAILCKDAINTSRVLKQVELRKGKILRGTLIAIRHDDRLLEFY